MFLNSVSTVLVGVQNDFEAMSIAWATQVEREHLIFSGPDHAAATLRVVEEQAFFMSLLANDQTEVARFFGGRKSKRSNLSNVEPKVMKGHLFVEGAVKSLKCRVIKTEPLGKQIMIAGKIEDTLLLNDHPLLPYNRPDYWS